MRTFLLALIFGLFAPNAALAYVMPSPSPADGWDHVALLEGHWRQVKNGEVNEEVWLNNNANLITGMSRTVKGLSNSYEFLRIENTKTGVLYLARPQGAKEDTPFLLTGSTPDQLVFVNPTHDWPMRIEYRRTGPDALEATVSGLDPTKGKVLKFQWTRVK